MNPGDIPDYTMHANYAQALKKIAELEAENERLRVGIIKHKAHTINEQRRNQDSALWELLHD